MKLHALNIQAFGPFSSKETIDFSSLGENPLFLIDGPTGAGKSSILHAICYALYGETTDSDRKGLGLRCDHASDDLLTEITLEFSIRGDRYRISRMPSQMRPAKRGEGETEQKASAHLSRILEGGEQETIVAKKVNDAGKKIEQIVGLTAEQFLQVMVLPQGKFRELLLAKSDDRQVILSTLFQTEIYKQIEQILKTKSTDLEKQNQLFEDRKAEALDDVDISNIEALDSAIKEATQTLNLKQADKNQAANNKQQSVNTLESAKTLLKSFEERLNKQQQLDKSEQRQAEIIADKSTIKLADNALAIMPKWQALLSIADDVELKNKDIERANSEEVNAKEAVVKTKKAVDQANEKYLQRDLLKAQEVELKGYQKCLSTYEPLKIASKKADQQYQDALGKKAKLEHQDKTIQDSINESINRVQTLTEEISDKATIVEQKITAKGRYDQRSQLETAHTELNQLNETYSELSDNLKKANASYEQATQQANRTEMHWFTNQAAILAEKLNVGQPCVVCGSLDHPNPAVYSSDISSITQEEVDNARLEQSKVRERLSACKEKCSRCEHNRDVKSAEIKKLENELAQDGVDSILVLQQRYEGLEQTLKKIEDKERQLDNINVQQIKEVAARAPVVLALNSLNETLPELNTQKASAYSQLERANSDLPETYRDAALLELNIQRTQQTIQAVETALTQANKQQMDALTCLTAIQSQWQQLTKDLKTLKEKQGQQLLLWQQALTASEFATQQAFQQAQCDLKTLASLRDKVQHYEDDQKKTRAELGLLDKQLKNQQQPELTNLESQVLELTQLFNAAELTWTQAQQHQTKLKQTHTKITQIGSQQCEIKKKFEVVGTLSKAASGRGNVRVSLERFVLGNLLDSVLSIASQRLHIMSKGQYRLIRQNEEVQKKNTTAGLDLAIDDAHTGKTRAVATLSGGESFLASLALALGLSDVVQERSGGIQLDTLFIDEGFGSLDQESLQLAINTLMDLQSAGRTIGIISHVSELKEQMAQRIDVIGSRKGSSIKLSA